MILKNTDLPKERVKLAREKEGFEREALLMKLKTSNIRTIISRLTYEQKQKDYQENHAVFTLTEATNESSYGNAKEVRILAETYAKQAEESYQLSLHTAAEMKEYQDLCKQAPPEWSQNIQYYVGDWVEYHSQIYQSKKDHRGVIPADPTTWKKTS